MIGDHFFAGEQGLQAGRNPLRQGSEDQAEQLQVELPKGNADFHSLAEG